MKEKMVAMLMVLVTLVSVVVYSTAAEYELPDRDSGYELLQEFAETMGFGKHLNGTVDGSKKYFCGMLSAEYFESESGGVECSAENYRELMLQMYEDLESMEVRQVGEIDGHPVYLVTGVSKPGTNVDGFEVVEILFMICK